jgi:hypothetical protein
LKRLAAGGKSTHSKALAAARRIVQAWNSGVRPDHYSIDITQPGSAARTTMMAALVELNSPALIEQFIRQSVLRAYDGSENAVLITAAAALGNKKAAEMLAALMEARMADRPSECAELLLALGVTNPPPSFRLVAKAAVEGIDAIGIPRKKVAPAAEDEDDGAFWWEVNKAEKRQKVPPEFITNLFSALALFSGRTLHDAAVGKISSRLEVFDPVTVVVPAIERMCAEQPPAIDSVIEHLWTSAAEFLLMRSEVPPQPPPDWRLQATLSCTCPDCAALQAFARDPNEQVHRFRINKDRRRHLHDVIKQYGLDMTHVTERVGSPQTLVCTKDRRTFQARMKEYKKEIAAMRNLVKLAPKSTAALSRSMEAAVKVSTT